MLLLNGDDPTVWNTDAILHRLVPLLRKNVIVVVFSNGGFDGIHGKLLAQLAA